MKLLTFGYIGTQVNSLARALDAMPAVVLVDVRLSPYSRATEWCSPHCAVDSARGTCTCGSSGI